MIEILRAALQQFLNDIDSGNSNITEDQQQEVINLIHRLKSKELSRTEAANYLGVCKNTFKNYIEKGLIPEGIKKQGFTELIWYQYDLDKYLQEK